ncbi:F-box/kelch-repeat protein [Trifolium pratense]|uniref:F-box/kelch-repeat protein n=1 Tax=Trifolium pratense TaxID=57577 RepID=A0A2K3LUX9_TRIPR|nr:F-box/kelch-repeat protein [Trifolium pratense]
MDVSRFQSRRRPTNALSSTTILPNDLITKAFSCLPVKSLMRLRCMSKFYNSLISTPFFIKMHLRHSSRNPHLAIASKQIFPCLRFIVPISKILENNLINFPFCLPYQLSVNEQCCWLKFYNPATKVESKELAYFEDHFNDSYFFTSLNLPSERSGVYFNGYVYWLALKNCVRVNMAFESNGITIDQFVIMSLDLSTETHMELLPPQGFHEVPDLEPTICVLKDSLCFCHDFKQTHFVIWKMEKFGVVVSWTQLVKISYDDQNLLSIFSWLPLHISEDNNTLILANMQAHSAMIYNLEENSVEMLSNEPLWAFSTEPVGSLFHLNLKKRQMKL